MYFDPGKPAVYVGPTFVLEHMRLRWFAQPHLKRAVLPRPLYHVGRAAGWAIDFFANIGPSLCARGWCYFVGGFDEIEFRFRKP
jgi:hypothetical protein